MGTKSSRFIQRTCLNCCKGDNQLNDSQNQIEEGKAQCYKYSFKTLQKQVEQEEKISIQLKQQITEIKKKKEVKKQTSSTSQDEKKQTFDKIFYIQNSNADFDIPPPALEKNEKNDKQIIYQLKANSSSFNH